MVPSCLIQDPGVIRAGGYWPGVGEPDRGDWRRWQGVGSGLVSLHMKGDLKNKLFGIL